MRVAGLMSGTSLDGIDVAIIDIDEDGFDTIAVHSVTYPPEIRAALLGVSNCATHTREIARLHFLLAELYAEAFAAACKASETPQGSIKLIGCHGQTIYHEGTPEPYLGRRIASTLQIGDGSVLAERTGVPVISDFRPRDIAAGGMGAPLVPLVDYLLFRDAHIGRVALNIGGIANITCIPAGASAEQVIAFDTGPGNMVIDQLIARFSEGRELFDRDGEMAAAGEVDAELLEELLRDEYYARRPPKTAGREQYGAAFVERIIARNLEPAATVATATMLTAATIAEGVYRFAGGVEKVQEVIAAGGGVHNRTLLRFLRAELGDFDVLSSADLGLDPDAKEAIAFAVLAHESWHRRPSNLPSATGARRAAPLGKLSF